MFIVQANKASKEIKSYKTKVINNRESIATIYSQDHANCDGGKKNVGTAAKQLVEPIEVSPEVAPKRQ